MLLALWVWMAYFMMFVLPCSWCARLRLCNCFTPGTLIKMREPAHKPTPLRETVNSLPRSKTDPSLLRKVPGMLPQAGGDPVCPGNGNANCSIRVLQPNTISSLLFPSVSTLPLFAGTGRARRAQMRTRSLQEQSVLTGLVTIQPSPSCVCMSD